MSAELDPETAPGLVGLTRLQSIAKPKDEDWCCDEHSNRTNSISLTNQSSYNQQSSHTNNQSNDTGSVSISIHSSACRHSHSNQSNQSNQNIINHLVHSECTAHQNEIVEPERSYRSKSFASHPHRTRLQSFSTIEKQDLYRQTASSGAEPKAWSFKHLKSEFKANNFERLFEKYQSRIQHNFFVLLLLLNIAFNLIAVTLYLYYDRPINVSVGVAIIRLFSILVNALLLVFMFKSEQYLLQKKSRIFCSLLTLTLAFVCEYSPSLFGVLDTVPVLYLRIRPTYFLILSNHVFLPHVKSRHAFYCTGFIVAIETALTIYSRLKSSCFGMAILWYSIADMIFHFTCALIGFFINTMLEVANRRAFLVYRSYIEGKFHLNNQLNQQADLMYTCIPKHLSERVKNDLKQALFDFSVNRNLPCKPFNELYIEKYNEVTILYADIVNSMALAANLDAQQLVITLNELYRRFDQVTEYNKCMRIKLLGDCYYCISKGEGENGKNHAENCVNTGLSMLDIIKDVRAKSQVDVDMRIGMHSGMVMSGLMGLYKWQYDIWSLDSMKAAHMEHTGQPGMLHLTGETLGLLPYGFRNKLLIKERFDLDQSKAKITYLVKKKHAEDLSLMARLKSSKKDNEPNLSSSLSTIKKGFDPTILIESILKYREMVNFVNSILESAIDEMPLTKKEEWFNSIGIQPLFLLFRTALAKTFNLTFIEMERRFSLQLDPLFECYLYCAGLIGLSITLIKYCMPKVKLPLRLIYSLFSVLGVIILSLVVVHYKQRLHLVLRLLIWLVISGLLICCATIDLISTECHIADLMDKDKNLINCAYTWYYTYSVVLAITSVSIFIRINYYLKLTLYIIFFTLFYYLIYDENSMVNLIDGKTENHRTENKWNFFGHLPQIGHVYYVIIVTIILHLIDRQIEYILRLEFQWTSKLDHEKKEAIHLEKVNRLLLLNILPEHIVARYMCDQIWIAPEKPHSESYKSVAVLFASMPNYSETYTENEMNGQGLKCLQILNEIIHDFDKLILFNEQFGEVEKIKTIGSTYMAATGLRSKRDSLYDPLLVDEEDHHRTVVITMVDFAIEMLKKLQRFNKDALQDLKLRIGIAVGPVVAGVIGASKPQYDIWGDTVNTSSRMDSFGRCGRIHVTEQVAEVLRDKSEYQLECRGEIQVKGKGQMITYLLRTPYDDDDLLPERVSTVI